jgi:hypothetical protein
MPDDYMERLEEARELIQLAGETDEGRAAARRWLRQVISAVGDAEPAVLQPVPPGLAGSGYIANRDAMRRSGYDATTVALSETGGAGTELYPDVRAAGHYDSGPAADGGTMREYTEHELAQAEQRDEVDRYGLMLRGGPFRVDNNERQTSWPFRPGPERGKYDDGYDQGGANRGSDDIVQATMEVAGRSGVAYHEVAAAVDELVALSDPDGVVDKRNGIIRSGLLDDFAARADALIELSGMFPGGGPETIGLARQRESDRIARKQGAMPSEAEVAAEEVDRLVRESRGMLSHEPRQGRTTLTTDEDYDKYAEQNDRRQPARGGVRRDPEVERIAREHGAYFHDPNTVYPVKTPRQRERAERRARPRHQAGLFSIEQMEARRRRGQRSAFSSRG